uniref:Uncharacterized protein n=1 Tax=Tanacetum cinerariifolium TaxID=118510 RepID=A0A6L2LI74_TANCI|nr:hypothetical protein [Tanacetum cinerariifolium]
MEFTVYFIAAATVRGDAFLEYFIVTDRVLEDGHRSKMYKVEPDLICIWEPDLVTKKVGTDLVLSWEPDLVTKKVGTDLVLSWEPNLVTKKVGTDLVLS